ncbi:MAG: energy transducer TonB [Verrucomicrobia bacterium]|nr:energy transducer TonB [Verrucomicrobiota bacterium]
MNSILSAADAIIEDVEEGGGGKVMPKVISRPPPLFPMSLLRSGAGGKVIVTFTVDEKGNVRDAVVTSSPQRQLNLYAVKAVGSWKFEPGTRDGQPASFRLRTAVEFATTAAETATNKTGKTPDGTPSAKRKPPVVYPYELVISGQPAWADASFVVDYVGRTLFTVSPASSNKAFGKAAVAMIEATEYNPGTRDTRRVMSPASEHFQYNGEASLDPESRRVLAELRKPKPAILAANELDERPKVLAQTAPTYPRALKDDGFTGQAEIEFIVSRDGTVMFPKIVSATHEDFGWAASVAVAQWRYQPPQKNGRAVEVRMTVPILFTAQKLAEAD